MSTNHAWPEPIGETVESNSFALSISTRDPCCKRNTSNKFSAQRVNHMPNMGLFSGEGRVTINSVAEVNPKDEAFPVGTVETSRATNGQESELPQTQSGESQSLADISSGISIGNSKSRHNNNNKGSEQRRGVVRKMSKIVSAAAREFEEELASFVDGGEDGDDNVFCDPAYFDKKESSTKTYNVGSMGHDGDEVPGIAESSDSSSDSDNDSFEERETKVRFSTVSIRSYSLTVGTHTKAKAYPLCLDWQHTPTETLDIDLFEEVFCTARTKPARKVVRGFRRPRRLHPNKRFLRLLAVTGQRQEAIYELELERTIRADALPPGACGSDDDYVEDESRRNPYQLCEVDDYQIVEC